MRDRPKPTAAEIEASHWLVRLDSEDAKAEDHRRFQTWLAASDEHKRAYEAVAATWDKLGALERRAPRSTAPQPATRIRVPWRAPLAGAAALAAVALIALILAPPSPRTAPIAETTYATDIGEQISAQLGDGSSILLNADTELRVAFSEAERRAILTKGAALFDVQPDPARPFIVETPLGTIRVRGTSFLVRVEGAQVRAIVVHGLVEGVSKRSLLDHLHDITGAAKPPATARAHQEILFGPEDVQVHEVSEQTLARRLAWREGMLAFDGETLAEAALEVTRQTGIRFEFADPRMGEMRVGGYVAARDSEAFLALLQTGLGIQARRVSPSVVRLENPPVDGP